MGWSGAALSRGLVPSRVGIGGRWREPSAPKGVIPGGRWHEAAAAPQRAFRSKKFEGRFRISMVTADSSGTPLGGCDVELYHAATDTVVGRTTSDPVGAFTFDLGNNSDFYYIRAYKAGTPDVAGTTVNTLMAI